MRQCLQRRRSPENFTSWVIFGSWAGTPSPSPQKGAPRMGENMVFYILVIKHGLPENHAFPWMFFPLQLPFWVGDFSASPFITDWQTFCGKACTWLWVLVWIACQILFDSATWFIRAAALQKQLPHTSSVWRRKIKWNKTCLSQATTAVLKTWPEMSARLHRTHPAARENVAP